MELVHTPNDVDVQVITGKLLQPTVALLKHDSVITKAVSKSLVLCYLSLGCQLV